MNDDTALVTTDQQIAERPRVFDNEWDLAPLLSTAGKLQATKEQEDALFAPVDETLVEIRPDGLVYLPWEVYQTRLRQVFPLRFAFIPQGQPKIRQEDGMVVWGFWLVIDGCLMGYALGEGRYRENNAMMSWTDACESAKSNAKMRLCKDIGMFAEMWMPQWIRGWKEKYAETYQVVDTRTQELKTCWRKKGTAPSISDHERAATPSEFVLPFKKAKELTGKERPTLADIAAVGKAGLNYLKYIAGWDEAKPQTRDAINAFLKDVDTVDGEIVSVVDDKMPPASEPTKITVQDTVENKVTPHWIDHDIQRKSFFAAMSSLKIRGKKITEDDIHTALGAKSIRDVTLTQYEAIKKVKDWVAEQNKGVAPRPSATNGVEAI